MILKSLHILENIGMSSINNKRDENNKVIIDRSKPYAAAIVFPNRYSIATANLGYQWLYYSVNKSNNFFAERFTVDNLQSIESNSYLKNFDIVLFSISFENDLFNLINFLQQSNIPIYANERDDAFPPLILGGAITYLNPIPFSKIFDGIVLGDGENKIDKLLGYYKKNISKQEYIAQITKEDFVINAIKLDGVLKSGKNNGEFGAWSVFTSHDSEFSDTFLIEITRGCTHLCRFCGAGYTYLPQRNINSDILIKRVETWGRDNSSVGLISPSPSDHPEIVSIIKILNKMGKRVTLSSIRADTVNDEIIKLIKNSGSKTLTIAPEAGSYLERKVINKDIQNDVFYKFANRAKNLGFTSLKLYFIIGREDSFEEIYTIIDFLYSMKKNFPGGYLSASFSVFVPKPNTPFQWRSMVKQSIIKEKIKYLKKEQHKIKINFMFENIYDAISETLIARGDSTVTDAFKSGVEKKQSIKKILKNNNELLEKFVYSSFEISEVFPWDIVKSDLNKSFLVSEYNKSKGNIITSSCKIGVCTRCGVCK